MIGSVYLKNPKVSFFIGDTSLMDAGLFDRYELQCNIPCSVCRRQDGILLSCPVCGGVLPLCGGVLPLRMRHCQGCGCIMTLCNAGDHLRRMIAGIAIPKVLAITDIQEDII